MTDNNIFPFTVYGTAWCGDCCRTRALLAEHQIAYTWVNIDSDDAARSLVQEVNHGNRSVPTIVFADGSILVEPSRAELKQKLGLD